MKNIETFLSNGELFVGLNEQSLVARLFFPYAGHAPHTAETVHKIGVRVGGTLTWLDDGSWEIKTTLPHGAPVAHTVARCDDIGILLEIDSFVSSEITAFIRNIHVVNLRPDERNVQLFLHQAFLINDTKIPEDTAQYVPDEHALLHYSGRRAFAAGGVSYDNAAFDQWTVGRFGEDGLDGTWRDAEDGELAQCLVDCGQTDSILRFSLHIPTYASTRVYYWLAASTSPRSALTLHHLMTQKNAPLEQLDKTIRHWHKLLHQSFKISQKITPTLRQRFITHAMAIHAHIDMHGAVIESSDAQTFATIQDAAYALWPMIRLGYRDEALRFFTFCRQAIAPDDGFLLPRYRADGAWAPATLPYKHGRPPLNPSDTAIVLFLFAQFCTLNHETRTLHDFYETLVRPMAHFLANYPAPDVSLYDASLRHAALSAAAGLADNLKKQAHSVEWRAVAEDIIYSLRADDDNSLVPTPETITVADFFGAFMFGAFEPQDAHFSKWHQSMTQRLQTESGLYKNADDGEIDVVASLRMAQYYIETDAPETADKILAALSTHMTRTGTWRDKHTRTSVWNSGEYLSTLLDTITQTP